MNKIKKFAVNAVNKVKAAFSAKQTEITAKAHAVLDGTVAETTENEDISIPQTGDKRKILPVIATLIVSGITAAYCVVKGKKTKKTKADFGKVYRYGQ